MSKYYICTQYRRSVTNLGCDKHTRDCVTRPVTSQKWAFILVDYRQSQTWLQPEALDIHSRKQLRQVCFREHELS